MAENFVIVSAPRAGSHMLTSMIGSHPDLKINGERMWLSRKQIFKAVNGFNTKYNTIKRLLWAEEFVGAKVIHLIRMGLLRQTASYMLHRLRLETGEAAHDISGMDTIDAGRLFRRPEEQTGDKQVSAVALDIDTFSKTMNTIVRKTKRFSSVFSGWSDAITVFYEDITDDRSTNVMPEKESDRICDFLGVDRCILSTEMNKLHSDMSESVSNWGDIIYTFGDFEDSYRDIWERRRIIERKWRESCKKTN